MSLEIAKRNYQTFPSFETAYSYIKELLRRNQTLNISEFDPYILADVRIEALIGQFKASKIILPGNMMIDEMSYQDLWPQALFVARATIGPKFDLLATTYRICSPQSHTLVFYGIDPNSPYNIVKIWNIPTTLGTLRYIPVQFCDMLENDSAAVARQIYAEKREASRCNEFFLYLDPELKKYHWFIMDLDKNIVPTGELPRRPEDAMPTLGDPYYPWDQDGLCPHWHVDKKSKDVKNLHYFGTENFAKKIIDNEVELHVRYV